MKKTILTGIQPSGKLHIGNYLGTLKNWSQYINEYDCYFFIADLHSLTENYDSKEKADQIFELAVEFLALGLDPGKCVFFRQSDIKEHTELAWIFSCVTPISYLERMTQYKDKAQDQKENINTGLFTYPVLQAADILLYDSDLIPVGKDQFQHVELTRVVARFFNNRFGQTFKEPEPLPSKISKVMSLLDPEKKMSKSHGEKTVIALSDEPDIIAQKLRKAVADGQGLENLYGLADEFIDGFDRSKYTDNNLKFKEDLATAISEKFADFRKERAKWMNDRAKVEKILNEGAKKARKVAEKKMGEVRKKIGLI